MYLNKNKKYNPLTIAELVYTSRIVRMLGGQPIGVPNTHTTTPTYATIEVKCTKALTPSDIAVLRTKFKEKYNENLEVVRSKNTFIPHYYITKLA